MKLFIEERKYIRNDLLSITRTSTTDRSQIVYHYINNKFHGLIQYSLDKYGKRKFTNGVAYWVKEKTLLLDETCFFANDMLEGEGIEY